MTEQIDRGIERINKKYYETFFREQNCKCLNKKSAAKNLHWIKDRISLRNERKLAQTVLRNVPHSKNMNQKNKTR